MSDLPRLFQLSTSFSCIMWTHGVTASPFVESEICPLILIMTLWSLSPFRMFSSHSSFVSCPSEGQVVTLLFFMSLRKAYSKFFRFLPFCQLLSLWRVGSHIFPSFYGVVESSVSSYPSAKYILPGLLSVILLTIYKVETTGYQQVTLKLRLDRQVVLLEEQGIVMAYFTVLSVGLGLLLNSKLERI